ncbi:RING finger protein 214 isoform X1 [Lates japonicus]|uniref:RING finger protein 214 isoform X1 n=1 Tax=Lates japonicus TaxID=270547 RepID=A0AAD3RH03_LATJO|nr:RING finger protein 214 isoform X1 [Lates japonicus]
MLSVSRLRVELEASRLPATDPPAFITSSLLLLLLTSSVAADSGNRSSPSSSSSKSVCSGGGSLAVSAMFAWFLRLIVMKANRHTHRQTARKQSTDGARGGEEELGVRRFSQLCHVTNRSPDGNQRGGEREEGSLCRCFLVPPVS